jgi:hypothetical protein
MLEHDLAANHQAARFAEAQTAGSPFSPCETFAQKPNGDSVMMVEAGRFGMADRVLGQ